MGLPEVTAYAEKLARTISTQADRSVLEDAASLS
jgi:hypothetical protein